MGIVSGIREKTSIRNHARAVWSTAISRRTASATISRLTRQTKRLSRLDVE